MLESASTAFAPNLPIHCMSAANANPMQGREVSLWMSFLANPATHEYSIWIKITN